MSGWLLVSLLLLHFWPFLKCHMQAKGKDRKETSSSDLSFDSSEKRPKGWGLKWRLYGKGLPWPSVGSLSPISITKELTSALSFLHCISEGGNCSSMLVSFPHLKNTRRKCKCTCWRLLLDIYCKIYASCKDTSGEGLFLKWGVSLGVAKLGKVQPGL